MRRGDDGARRVAARTQDNVRTKIPEKSDCVEDSHECVGESLERHHGRLPITPEERTDLNASPSWVRSSLHARPGPHVQYRRSREQTTHLLATATAGVYVPACPSSGHYKSQSESPLIWSRILKC